MLCLFFQLIQDEIKALVQLQNRQASIHSHTEFSPTPMSKTPPPLLSSGCTVLKNVAIDNDNLAAPAHTLIRSPSPPLQRSETVNLVEERATTVLSSGYGTLSVWETGPQPAESPGENEDGSQVKEKQHLPSYLLDNTETAAIRSQQNLSNERTVRVEDPNPLVYQQGTSGYVLSSFLDASDSCLRNICKSQLKLMHFAKSLDFT